MDKQAVKMLDRLAKGTLNQEDNERAFSGDWTSKWWKDVSDYLGMHGYEAPDDPVLDFMGVLVERIEKLEEMSCRIDNRGEKILVVTLALSRNESEMVNFATEDWIVQNIKAALKGV